MSKYSQIGKYGLMAALLLLPSWPAMAQKVEAPGGYAPLSAPCSVQTDGICRPLSADAPLPVAPPQERLVLVSGNEAAAARTVLGGRYILSQSCGAYGTLALRYRGADGATMLPLVTKGASDATTGTSVYLANAAVVDAAISGTTGCNAILSRVP
ncbi:hypothetical protein [Sphingobium chlorophenolicum]|uniref:Secreted protein n=1 Tax=Sphingobium chlorophenolicum TaxID=46429 RepID=A0A081RGC5_SPHCR|nr:hypothetical protein [Sphingobium chlorophenolicum]KEQ54248.1 putative uncharacterized protein precursor [Sphingobium chlorophenolicum]